MAHLQEVALILSILHFNFSKTVDHLRLAKPFMGSFEILPKAMKN